MSEDKRFRQVTVRFQRELFDDLVNAAEQDQRSLAGLLRHIATQYLDAQRRAQSTGTRPTVTS